MNGIEKEVDFQKYSQVNALGPSVIIDLPNTHSPPASVAVIKVSIKRVK